MDIWREIISRSGGSHWFFRYTEAERKEKMKSVPIPDACPRCGASGNGESVTIQGEHVTPMPGDICLCGHCASVVVIRFSKRKWSRELAGAADLNALDEEGLQALRHAKRTLEEALIAQGGRRVRTRRK